MLGPDFYHSIVFLKLQTLIYVMTWKQNKQLRA